ncbi:tripeptidyl-peptidase 1 [Apiospora sp. TS-2023a]
MKCLLALALMAVLCIVSGTADTSASILVESLGQIPAGWMLAREVNPNQNIRLRIALEQPNLDIFEQTLYSISTPQHPQYGRHLSRDELAEIMKPRQDSTAAVLSWLQSSGVPVSDIEDAGEWVNFKITVGKAQDLLNTTFAVYKHVEAGAEILRTLQYSVPAAVKPHMTMIQPTTRFGQVRAKRPEGLNNKGLEQSHVKAEIPKLMNPSLNTTFCNSTATPDCLRTLYSIGDYTADPSVGSVVGVAGFLEQWARFDDLNLFLSQLAPYAITQNFSYILVNNGQNNQTDTTQRSDEANLDIEYVSALAFNTDIRFYSTGGRGLLVPDPDLPDDELPTTLTTSYGESERTVPEEYAKKVCDMFGQMGARGISVIFASGDYGPGSVCQTNDGTNTTRFDPIFPAACPYVTSVGGTVGVEPESATGLSSGGFSDIWARPAYQETPVQIYLQNLGDQWAGLYNQSGRGFPDVAAQAENFLIVDRSTTTGVSGTSAAAPTFAAIISLLNNARMKNGLSPMGFLNPWLYSSAVAGGGLTDITTGGSVGCTGGSSSSGPPTPYVPYASWNATQGWDPVTGLGTPLFDMLLQLALAAPNSTRHVHD